MQVESRNRRLHTERMSSVKGPPASLLIGLLAWEQYTYRSPAISKMADAQWAGWRGRLGGRWWCSSELDYFILHFIVVLVCVFVYIYLYIFFYYGYCMTEILCGAKTLWWPSSIVRWSQTSFHRKLTTSCHKGRHKNVYATEVSCQLPVYDHNLVITYIGHKTVTN